MLYQLYHIMQEESMAFEIFISYAHEDHAFRLELDKHLSNLRRQQIISSWYDGDITPGTEWQPQIMDHLHTAQIILLLVSADFMASDFCYSIEMKLAIARHNADQARVIPIILRPTDWKGAPFANLKVLPTDGKPVSRWPSHDDAFENIVQGIRAAVDDLMKEGTLRLTDRKNTILQNQLGKSHTTLSAWLSQTWLRGGHPVCFVEGFSGVGKTSLARGLMHNAGWTAVMVDMPDTGSDQFDDLLLDLASELSLHGVHEMANAVDSGTPLPGALEGVLRSQILIVVDEFQRTLDASGRPMSAFEHLLERIAKRTNFPGRLLLLSNRSVERGKWSEAFSIQTLSALEPEAAELLLDSLLEQANRSQEVSKDRRRDVVNWLGCNPRAIRVLVASLEQDSLDELIGLNPESWELRDRQVSQELLERLERELLELTLSHFIATTNRLLRQLSVHRKSVKREALEILLPIDTTWASTRDELISRFLMEQHSGWFTLNPIVREISLQRLKQNPAELRQAHSKAADHYMRHFTAKNIVGGGQLGGNFVEARYHLVQAQRGEELSSIAGRFENHLKESFTSVSPIPKEPNELNERIAVLSALLETPGSKGLEYYLARLYVARGVPNDLPEALTYAQRATGSRAPAASWVLRIRLEGQINGPERALQVCRVGIDQVPADKGLVDLYRSCGEVLAQAGRFDEAITLLKEGIGLIPADKSLVSLYQSCGKVLAQAGRADEAITLLKEGIARISPDQNLADLYLIYAKLLARSGELDQAIALLREGIGRIPIDRWNGIMLLQDSLFYCAATGDIATLDSFLLETSLIAIDTFNAEVGRVLRFQIQKEWKQAAETAHQLSTEFPTSFILLILEAFSWLSISNAKAANEILQRFQRLMKIDKGSPIFWLNALIAVKNGDQPIVRENLSSYLGRSLADQEEINIDFLLRLWDVSPESLEGHDLAFYFPSLPTSITGLSHEVVHIPFGPPVLKINTSTFSDGNASVSTETEVSNTKQYDPAESL
jgi:tetratricopeptide (TPR) repeat protein